MDPVVKMTRLRRLSLSPQRDYQIRVTTKNPRNSVRIAAMGIIMSVSHLVLVPITTQHLRLQFRISMSSDFDLGEETLTLPITRTLGQQLQLFRI